MKTIKVKIHEFQDVALERTAKAERVSKGELIRRSVDYYLSTHPAPRARQKKQPSMHNRLKKYCGMVKSGVSDLATNPEHMQGFGRDYQPAAKITEPR